MTLDSSNQTNFKSDFAHIFKCADKNCDGTMTLCELNRQMQLFGYVNLEKQLEAYFSKIGADSNGITEEQFLASMHCAPSEIHRAAYLRRVFKQYDRDCNGKLDKREFGDLSTKLGEKFTKEEIEIVMMVLDKNLNSFIDLEEFICAVNQNFMNLG